MTRGLHTDRPRTCTANVPTADECVRDQARDQEDRVTVLLTHTPVRRPGSATPVDRSSAVLRDTAPLGATVVHLVPERVPLEGRARDAAPTAAACRSGFVCLPRRVDDHQEVVTVGKKLTGPRILEVAVVLVVVAPQGLPARQAKDWLSRLPEARDVDVADPSLHPDLGLLVVMGLAEVDLTVRCHDADAAKVDQLVTLDRGPAARVLPTAYFHHDVHLLMVPSGGDVSKRLLR